MSHDRRTSEDGIPAGVTGIVTVSHTDGNPDGPSVLAAVRDALNELDIQGILVREVGSAGRFDSDPAVAIHSRDLPQTLYGPVNSDAVVDLLSKHLVYGELDRANAVCQVPGHDGARAELPDLSEIPFFSRQSRSVSHRCGVVIPARIDDVIHAGGYEALDAVLRRSPADCLDALENSGLHGHGGKGAAVMQQWASAAAQDSECCLICNGLEVDGSSTKDRHLLEGDPHSLIEGMAIAAFAVGARMGIVVLNPVYRLARKRLASAIAEARRHRRLGNGIRGSDFDFDLTVRSGPTGYAAGEESALVSYLEGKAGPRVSPPQAAASGLNGCPTVVGNVETFARLTTIPFESDEEGPPPSRLFTLEGTPITGVVEVEVGTTVRELVCGIGNAEAQDIGAVSIGGRMGGILSPDLLDTPLSQQSYKWLSIWPGTGLVTVMDKSFSIQIWLQEHLKFTASESCGYCSPCREGLAQANRIGEKLGTGSLAAGDITTLDRLGEYVRTSSMCSYGRAVPSGVSTALRHFGKELREQVGTGQ